MTQSCAIWRPQELELEVEAVVAVGITLKEKDGAVTKEMGNGSCIGEKNRSQPTHPGRRYQALHKNSAFLKPDIGHLFFIERFTENCPTQPGNKLSRAPGHNSSIPLAPPHPLSLSVLSRLSLICL